MKNALLEELYSLPLLENRIEKVLTAVSPMCKEIDIFLELQLKNPCLLYIFKELTEGIQQVLLYGGNSRSFKQTDSNLFTTDLEVIFKPFSMLIVDSQLQLLC